MSGSNTNKKKFTQTKTWKRLRPVVIVLISLAIVITMLSVAFGTIIDRYLSPVDTNDATPIEFVLQDGWGASTVAKHLYEACGEDEEGLISNKAVFKIYVDFMGKSKDLKAGRYYLSKNMDIPTIIDVLCSGGGEDLNVVRVTIREGATVEDIVKVLKESGMLLDEETFLNICRGMDSYGSYAFKSSDDVKYALEGYLFPDTYEFYKNASSETVISTLLARCFDIYNNSEEDYEARAAELGLSMNEVLSLAAMLEREAVHEEDFYRVSAVFHTRLKQGMKLESDSTLSYILNTESKIEFTSEEVNVDSRYNTHVYNGLPIGPICNPGRLAIDAALNPDPDYMEEGYLFFCLTTSDSGALVYAKTNAEHEANVAKYRPYW